MAKNGETNKKTRRRAWKAKEDKRFRENQAAPRKKNDDVATRRQVEEEVNFYWQNEKELLLKKARTLAQILMKHGREVLGSFDCKKIIHEYKHAHIEQIRELEEVKKHYTGQAREMEEESSFSENSSNDDMEFHNDMFSLLEKYQVPVKLMDEIEQDIQKSRLRKEVRPGFSSSKVEKAIERAKANERIHPRGGGGTISVQDMVEKINKGTKSGESGSEITFSKKNNRSSGSNTNVKALGKKYEGSQGTTTNRSSRKMGR